jgi:hypothetical protein
MNVQENKNTPFQCRVCSKILANKQSLDRHEPKCNNINPLQCPICFKCFTSSSGKCQHRKNVSCVPPHIIKQSEPDGLIGNVNAGRDANIAVTTTDSHNTTTNNFIFNWSDEHYAHVTPHQLKDIITKCLQNPKEFFSEFPKVAHQGAHKNLKLNNVRSSTIDVYENGKFDIKGIDSAVEDCAKKMIYRLDDVTTEHEVMFKRFERITKAILDVESMLNENVGKQCESLRIMKLKWKSAGQDIIKELKIGLKSATVS